jgi:hypothetical protein
MRPDENPDADLFVTEHETGKDHYLRSGPLLELHVEAMEMIECGKDAWTRLATRAAPTPPLMIAGLATLGSFEEPPDHEEIAAMYRLTKRMATLARTEPFILMADGTTLLVSVYQPTKTP